MRDRKLQVELTLFGVMALVLALDRLTKAAVVRYLPYQVPWNPIPALRPVVTLTRVHNTGAAFGLFPNGSVFLAIIALLVVAAILYYYRRFPTRRKLVWVSLGMQLGGALGNLIDRLYYGYVIDFLDFHFWPVFNVADSSLSIGAVILAYYLLFIAEKDAAAEERRDSAAVEQVGPRE